MLVACLAWNRRQERENHDLRLEEAREGAKEYRNTVLEGKGLTCCYGYCCREKIGLVATAPILNRGIYISRAKRGKGMAESFSREK